MKEKIVDGLNFFGSLKNKPYEKKAYNTKEMYYFIYGTLMKVIIQNLICDLGCTKWIKK